MLTQRNILSGAAAASLLPIPSVTAEKAAERVQRLFWELSEALDDWAAGDFMVEIYPTHVVTDGIRSFQFEPARYALNPEVRIGRCWRNLRQAFAEREGLVCDDIFAVIERQRFRGLRAATSKD
jgi:hypothetical protein